MAAAGISCSQRLGDVVATSTRGRGHAVVLLGAGTLNKAPSNTSRRSSMRPGCPAARGDAAHRGAAPTTQRAHLVRRHLGTLAEGGRPSSRAHAALLALGAPIAGALAWSSSGVAPASFSYRQVERTFGLVVGALAKEHPDGAPDRAGDRARRPGRGVHPERGQESSTSFARGLDRRRDLRSAASESCSRRRGPRGHLGASERRPGQRRSLLRLLLSAATMVAARTSPGVPELMRRIMLSSSPLDPVVPPSCQPHDMVARGALGDMLNDSGYAHRRRALGPAPGARGPIWSWTSIPMTGHRGTFRGAICFNGNLYCPSTPRASSTSSRSLAVPAPSRLPPTTPAAPSWPYKLGPISAEDADGYHRVMCPAAAGQGALPAASRLHDPALDRPEVLAPPDPAPRCCTS